MRICVLVPSEDHLVTAGVRIRYQRIGAILKSKGHTLEVSVIDTVQPQSKQLASIYLLCKCHDARSLVLAAELRSRGVHLGADFFDDYYSQGGDSRFVYIREWLRDIAHLLTFALSSTPLMLDTLRTLRPDLPSHMMNDPFDAFDEGSLGRMIDIKMERARATRRLDIGWFGIGDNPHFPVGLSDLKDFGGALEAFNSCGFSPRLSILTNRRALTSDRLELLSRLPLPWRLEEWSEAGERQLVAESYVCFLPVNAQRFSTVKSLNRCVTALAGGAQVLSTGYPLYRSLGDFVYHNAADVVADLRFGTPKLRAESLAPLLNLLHHHADPHEEANRLEVFLENLPDPTTARPAKPSLAVIHGRLSTSLVHKLTQRLGHLSVTGPWNNAPLNYDVRIAPLPGGAEPAIQLSDKAVKRLDPQASAKIQVFTARDGKTTSFLQLAPGLLADTTAAMTAKLGYDTILAANYTAFMQAVAGELRLLFPLTGIVFSEYSAPFWHSAKKNGAKERDANSAGDVA